jgi:hypothetical protein
MTLTHILLGISTLSTGLFTGLLMTVLFFFERALKDRCPHRHSHQPGVGGAA